MRVPRFSVGRAGPIAAILAVTVAFPMAVTAVVQTFSDVPPTHPFFADIEALAASGVTRGCAPDLYCPDDTVTRGQMAAFLNRLGALGEGRFPVANAKTSLSTDGWSFGCPGGTTWSQGMCFETTAHPAENLWDAAETCRGLGGPIGGWRYHLPTAVQLWAARSATGVVVSPNGEVTDSLHADDGQQYYMAVFNNGSTAQVPVATTLAFRCVTDPQRLDLFITLP